MQLACAIAGIAFAEGRLDEAAEIAAVAASAAKGLQIDREIPLTTALAARIAVARGDGDAARTLAVECLRSVARLQEGWPAALALETATVVLGAALVERDRTALLAAATAVRGAGDRPAPHSLRLPAPTSAIDTAGAPDTHAAIDLALRLLDA